MKILEYGSFRNRGSICYVLLLFQFYEMIGLYLLIKTKHLRKITYYDYIIQSKIFLKGVGYQNSKNYTMD